MRRRVVVLIACGVAVAWMTGRAYQVSGNQWNTGTVTMRLQLGSPGAPLIDGSADWNTVAENALSIWNIHLRDVTLRGDRSVPADPPAENDMNEVVFDDDIYGEALGDHVATTVYWYYESTHRIVEADTVFNRNVSWDSYRGAARTRTDRPLYDLRRAALRQFGFALGLDPPDQHGQSLPAILNTRLGDIDTIQTDDFAGITSVYGPVVRAGTLFPNERLNPGRALTEAGLRYRLLYQTDGNLVLFDDANGATVWQTNTSGAPGALVMQGDGNLVLYDAAGGARWASATSEGGAVRLVVQGDGNVVLYRSDSRAIWDRNRAQSPPPAPPPSATPSLSGAVLAQGGARLAGATVQILDGPNAGHSTTTDGAGDYRFDAVTAGAATVSAAAAGYAEQRSSVTISGATTLNLTLEPIGTTPRLSASAARIAAQMSTAVLSILYTGTRPSTMAASPDPLLRVWEWFVPRLHAQGHRWTYTNPEGGAARIELPLDLPFIGDVTLANTATVWEFFQVGPVTLNGTTSANGRWVATAASSPIRTQGSLTGSPIGAIPVNLTANGNTGVYNGQIGDIPVGAVLDGPFIPNPVRRFDGGYTGGYVVTRGALPPGVSTVVAFTVSGGTITVTSPVGGQGTVSNTGSADFRGDLGGTGCTFTGTFTVTPTTGGAGASGSWDCGPGVGGTWQAARR